MEAVKQCHRVGWEKSRRDAEAAGKLRETMLTQNVFLTSSVELTKVESFKNCFTKYKKRNDASWNVKQEYGFCCLTFGHPTHTDTTNYWVLDMGVCIYKPALWRLRPEDPISKQYTLATVSSCVTTGACSYWSPVLLLPTPVPEEKYQQCPIGFCLLSVWPGDRQTFSPRSLSCSFTLCGSSYNE